MRLIDADTIKIPTTSVDAFENCKNCKLLDEYQVKEIIDNAETIDAEPIRHGEWKHYKECGITNCSVCDWCIDESWSSNYCPNCGAKMDVERKESV